MVTVVKIEDDAVLLKTSSPDGSDGEEWEHTRVAEGESLHITLRDPRPYAWQLFKGLS